MSPLLNSDINVALYCLCYRKNIRQFLGEEDLHQNAHILVVTPAISKGSAQLFITAITEQHLQECAIREGDIDFDRIMPLFASYEGTWVPEIWRGHIDKGKGFIQALIRLKKYDI